MALDRQRRYVGYGLTQSLTDLAPRPIVAQRDPTSADKAEIGTTWVNYDQDSVWVLASIKNGLATWTTSPASGVGVFTSVDITTGDLHLMGTPGDIIVDQGDLILSNGNALVSGNLTVTGDFNLTGDFDIVSADQISFTSSFNGASAITLEATAGGIDILASGASAGEDIVIASTGSSVHISASEAAADAIVLSASNAAGGVQIDAGSAGLSFGAVNGPIAIVSGTGAITIGADATDHDITMGSLIGVSALTLQSGTGNMTLQSASGGGVAVVSGDTFVVDADDLISINSSGSTISIGDDADAFDINIGTGAAARVITIGNSTGATALDLQAAGGGINIESSDNAATAIVLNASDAAGGITLSAGTGLVNSNTGIEIVLPAASALVGLNVDTSGGSGATATFTSADAETDAIQLTNGGILVDPVVSAAGASPRTVDARFGQALFTDVINAAAAADLVVSNTKVSAGSVVLATVSCATVGSALVINNVVPGAGSVTFSVTNLGGSNTAADILINFWILS